MTDASLRAAERAAQRKPRRQCRKCPWKVTTDPHEIPNGYCETKHKALKGTIAEPGSLRFDALRLMACHETKGRTLLPCVGWLVHQLGEGNNLALRLRVMSGQVDANVETVGEQHTRFEDTLP